MKIIISGGGTGGHIYPAIAVAQELTNKLQDIEILFVGAKGKMEMEKVPKAGFKIKGLWISGFQRKLTLKNLLFPIKLINSLWQAYKIVNRFKPDAVIGFGGFASGPVGQIAAWKKIPLFLQEQNSYPGITNKLLADKAKKICVAYQGLEKYFPSEKIVITGNPVRKDIINSSGKITDKDINSSLRYFDLVQNKKTVLVFGGSLGAGSLNEAVKLNLRKIMSSGNVNLIWQVGKYYYEDYKYLQEEYKNNLKILPFIDRMDLAYKISDLVVCRAGALTISELSLAAKAAILVPSPNVAEDHQTKNALNLVQNNAAVMIKDVDVRKELGNKINEILHEPSVLKELEKNIAKLAKPNASAEIAEVILKELN
ncbi:MAG TPA: undecaprenyldiphospho-muramoylpentapeptide beta-N-acetylglucosaminyltransferase [Bacteroidetes bacterium]|nr:undecaprenyldiphospho-muramoylpentapeptide beta-N-acetylglucosaminyltransferase [Bacteroidota bacterium]